MDEISWFNDVYSDMFSLEFDNLFSTIDFEIFESKGDSATEINNKSNTTNTASERASCAHRDNIGNKQLTSAGRVQVSSDL